MDAKKVLTGLDVYRDGGSISVSYDCGDVAYRMIFPIDRDRIKFGADGSHHSLFKEATLDEYRPHQWTSKTGVTYDDTKHTILDVSWAYAKSILCEIAPQMNGFVSDYLDVFDEMVQVAETEGTGFLRDAMGRVIP